MARSMRKQPEVNKDSVVLESRIGRSFSLGLFDVLLIAALLLWTYSLNSLGLGVLEFFRHTEADRVLIAWEMRESGSYLVPHLLDSVILTKPPLYYWILSASFWLFGSISEWTARFPSVVASLFLVVAQFVFARAMGMTSRFAFLTAMMLSSSISTMALASVAEIDMTFGLFCNLSFYCTAIALTHTISDKRNVSSALIWTSIAALATACAFLTKGPPVLLFLVAGVMLYLVFEYIVGRKRGAVGYDYKIIATLVGVAVAIVLGGVAFWLVPLAVTVGWDTLQHQLDTEVVQRVVARSRHNRGIFFYPFRGLTGAAPWSLFLIVAFAVVGSKTYYGRRLLDNAQWLEKWFPRDATRDTSDDEGPLKILLGEKYRVFFLFNAALLIAGILMLSLAEGKSNRYLFPLHGAIINLCALSLISLSPFTKQQLLRVGGYIAGITAVIFFILPLAKSFEGVPLYDMLLASSFIGGVCVALVWACITRKPMAAIWCLFLLMYGVRFAQVTVYAPHRNTMRTVKGIATAMNKELPKDIGVYTVELFERWTLYYMKHMGKNVRRLTPELVMELSTHQDRVVLLLSNEEESWRYEQLRRFDETTKLLGEYISDREHVLAVEVSTIVLPRLQVREVFPTTPTEPFPMFQ